MVLRLARVLAVSGLPVQLVARDEGLSDLGLPVLVESAGPVHALSGVLAALEAVGPGGRALIAPCDLPDLDRATVESLMAEAPPRIALGQPLLAWLPGDLAETVRRLRDAGAPVRALRFLTTQVAVSPAALRNVNLRSDLDPPSAESRHALR